MLRITGLAGAALASWAATICMLAAGAPPALAAPTCTNDANTSGAVSSFSLQPSSPLIADPSLDTVIDFCYGSSTDTAKDVTVDLAPGLEAYPPVVGAECTPAELTAATCPAASTVGSGTVTATLLGVSIPAAMTMYAMTPPSGDTTDVAYFGLSLAPPAALAALLGNKVLPNPLLTLNAGAQLATVNGQPVVQLNFTGLPQNLSVIGLTLPLQVTGIQLTVNGTTTNADGTAATTPFIRMPTDCSGPATSLMTMDTQSGASGGGDSSFTAGECSGLSFNPSVSVTATKDAGDAGVALTASISQSGAGAGDRSVTLSVPASTLSANLAGSAGEFGQSIGSVTAVTPAIATPLQGTLLLTGSAAAPAMTISFPPPVPLSFSGTVDLIDNALVFSSVPDVPFSSLVVSVNGGPTGLFQTTCAKPSGALVSTFVSQNGQTTSVSGSLTVAGCPTSPPAGAGGSGSPAGSSPLPTEKPAAFTAPSVHGGSLSLHGSRAQLRFALRGGTDKLVSFTVGLPSGLRFDRAGLVTGVKVSGGRPKSLRLRGGKLVVTLRSPASAVTISIAARGVDELAALARKVKAKQVKSLTVTIRATTSAQTKSLGLELKA